MTLRVPVDLLDEIKAEADDCAEYVTNVMLRRLAARVKAPEEKDRNARMSYDSLEM